MEIQVVRTRREKKEYIRFIYALYRDDPGYCDMNLTFVRNFLYLRDSFAKRQEVIPVMVLENAQVKAECIYVIDETDEIKLSFLEFVPNAEKYLIGLREYSEKLMGEKGKKKVVIGVNGQISYGLGILVKETNREFEFNSNYNRDYYVEELDKVFSIRKKAFSYHYNAEHSLQMIDPGILEQVNARYEFRYLDLKHFKRDMLILGQLCHDSLKGTPYYSEKKPIEMYELMRQIRFLMKREDILFAMKDGKEIGFVYTHPDYAQLFDRPKLKILAFYLRYLYRKSDLVIYNVIGVLPEHQASGLAVAMIHKTIELRRKEYPFGVSSFILEENIPSTRLCRKMSIGIHKEYRLYEIWSEQDVSKD